MSLEERINVALDALDQYAEALQVLANRVDKIERNRTVGSFHQQDHQQAYRFESYDRTASSEQVICGMWNQLAQWVAWLVHTYRLTDTVPPCWAQHPAIVEELKGLRVAWIGAWIDPQARHDAVVVFHEQLWRTRERLSDPNWGDPRCTSQHDDSGFSQDIDFQNWKEKSIGSQALKAAIDLSLRKSTATDENSFGR